MAAYIIVQIAVTDPVRYEDYRRAAPGAIRQYGGRYIVRGGKVEIMEGSHDGRRIVVLEFPTLDDARRFWHSPEYAEARKFREGAATMDAWLVPGVE